MTVKESAKKQAESAMWSSQHETKVKHFTEDDLAQFIELAINNYLATEPTETEQRLGAKLLMYRKLRASDPAHAHNRLEYMTAESMIEADKDEVMVGRYLINQFTPKAGTPAREGSE